MAKVDGELPADNGPYRDGKGTLYEGGTRVVALANWPGKIKPGVVDGMIHVVDMYPTLAGLAGAKLGKNKPLDGLNVWPMRSAKESRRRATRSSTTSTVSRRRAPGRLEAGLAGRPAAQDGALQSRDDTSETTDLAAANPDKVKELQARITELASEMAPPLLLMEAVRLTFFAPPSTPDPSVLFNRATDRLDGQADRGAGARGHGVDPRRRHS